MDLFAESPAENATQPLFGWNLLWTGSFEESASNPLNFTLHNRGEFNLNILPLDLLLRARVLDRRTLNFELDDPWGNPRNEVTNYTGGLYHTTTRSRLLYGVLDESGLSARIRNPWIRSPPYTENHNQLIADLRTEASTTREDELYLYLSSPFLEMPSNIRLRGFASAQIQESTKPAFSGGLDAAFNRNTNLLLEAFYTEAVLPETKVSSWFSDPPQLPERNFNLYAAGVLFNGQNFSFSGDFALSQTFAWGADIYANAGITFTPLLSAGRIPRPLTISFAADGAGARFIYRDGGNHGAGFRAAAKIEMRGSYSALFRIDTVLRGPGFGEDFNRSSSEIYWRFPAVPNKDNSLNIRLTRVSVSANRNAVNLRKIEDRFTADFSLSINLPHTNPLGLTFTGSIDGLSEDENPSPYPILNDQWEWNNASVSCDISWSPGVFQFRSSLGINFSVEKEEVYDFSISTSIRFSRGRLTIRAASPELPKKWNWTLSWRLVN